MCIRDSFFTNSEGVIALIPLRSAISECQKQGISLADIVKTNTMARTTWANLRKIFDLILERIGLEEQGAELQVSKEATENDILLVEPKSRFVSDLYKTGTTA